MDTSLSLNDTTPAYFTYPDDKTKVPGIILIHEIWGLVDHIKDVARRLTTEGYTVLAPNLFAGTNFNEKVAQSLVQEMANPATRDEAQKKMREIFAPTRSPEFAQEMFKKLEMCFDFLKNDAHTNGRIAIIGFCFGGTFSFGLATREPGLAAAISFYGRPPEPLDLVKKILCPILAFYGDNDAPLMESLPQLKNAMNVNGKNFESVVYPDAGHAFFNDTNSRMYNKPAAEDSWKRTLDFLKKYLAG
jgi:carboxymethylenebutenolidase